MQTKEKGTRRFSRTGLFGLVVAFLMLAGDPAQAAGFDDSDLKSKNSADYSGVHKANGELTDFSLDTEIESDGIDADRAAAEQARRDESRLKDELAQMKQQKQVLEAEKGKVQADTKAAFDSLAVQNKQNTEARKALDSAKKAKAIEDQKNAAVRKELQTVVNEGNALKTEQHKIDTYIQMAKQERAEAIRKMSEMRAQAQATRQRQQAQMKQIETYRRKTKEFVERETAKSRAIAARGALRQ